MLIFSPVHLVPLPFRAGPVVLGKESGGDPNPNLTPSEGIGILLSRLGGGHLKGVRKEAKFIVGRAELVQVARAGVL